MVEKKELESQCQKFKTTTAQDNRDILLSLTPQLYATQHL